MKICILTQPLHVNYGGLLQAYALQKVLKRMGHDVVTDRYGAKKYMSFYKRVLYFGYYFYKRCLLKDKRYMPFDYLFTSYKSTFVRHEKAISSITEHFIDSNISTTNFFAGRPFPSSKVLESYDALIVGSDQVWRPSYSHVSSYFLDFAKCWHGKKVVYAASFGLDNWGEFSASLTKQCSEAAQFLDAISVREDSGVQLCNNYLGINAKQVLDPTLLLNKEDYLELIEEDEPKEQENIMMCYILDQSKEKLAIVDALVQKKGLTPMIVVPETELIEDSNRTFNAVSPSISKWISGFRDSDFIITDSFHGTVFSILFNKPFIVIGNCDRGLTRFSSLLSSLGLMKRLVFSLDDIDSTHLTPIDYNEIDEKLNKWKEKSYSFLEESLKLCKPEVITAEAGENQKEWLNVI